MLSKIKLSQYIRIAGLISLAAFIFACGSDDSSAPDTTPKITSLSIFTGTLGNDITVYGLNLLAPDSVKLGKSKVTVTNNTIASFDFKVPSSTFTGKLYFYKGTAVDSSQTFTVIEPTGPVLASTLTYFLNGREVSCETSYNEVNINGVRLINIVGRSRPSVIHFMIPFYTVVNQTVPASLLNTFYYGSDEDNLSLSEFRANGFNGSHGSFFVTERDSNEKYLRGTFNFLGVKADGTRVNITNGRLGLRLQ